MADEAQRSVDPNQVSSHDRPSRYEAGAPASAERRRMIVSAPIYIALRTAWTGAYSVDRSSLHITCHFRATFENHTRLRRALPRQLTVLTVLTVLTALTALT